VAEQIHCVVGEDGVVRYRRWLTTCDAYVDAPMSREEMLDELICWEVELLRAHAERRLRRALHHGTSVIDERRSKDRWATERCNRCGSFHHPYEPRGPSRLCAGCGLTEDECPGPQCEVT
jgi:ribosomal protein L37E